MSERPVHIDTQTHHEIYGDGLVREIVRRFLVDDQTGAIITPLPTQYDSVRDIEPDEELGPEPKDEDGKRRHRRRKEMQGIARKHKRRERPPKPELPEDDEVGVEPIPPHTSFTFGPGGVIAKVHKRSGK